VARWMIRNEIPDRVAVAWFVLGKVVVTARSDALDQEMASVAAELRSGYADPNSAAPILSPARALYHGLGIDPTKTRPSSEALIRRILLGKDLYHVNTAVDAANLASIRCRRPVGLYDAERIDPLLEQAEAGMGMAPTVVLRMGMGDEEYAGIGKEVIHLEGRPTLADRQGPFGNPSSDSDRTKVTTQTRALLFVLYESPGEPDESTSTHLDLSRSILIRHLSGSLES
jgi:DNA/RNA-binding domain of Phe-tRNA-synthetase-like protein